MLHLTMIEIVNVPLLSISSLFESKNNWVWTIAPACHINKVIELALSSVNIVRYCFNPMLPVSLYLQ